MGIFRYDDGNFIDIESNLCDIDSIYNEKYQDLEKIKIKLNCLKLLNGDSLGNNLQLAISDVANEMGNLNIKINAIDAILESVHNYRNEVENYENSIKTHFDDYWGEFYKMCKIRVDDPDYYELGDFVYEHPAVANFVFDAVLLTVAALTFEATAGGSVGFVVEYCSTMCPLTANTFVSSLALKEEMAGNHEYAEKYLAVRDYDPVKYAAQFVADELEINTEFAGCKVDEFNRDMTGYFYVVNGIDILDILNSTRGAVSFTDVQCEDYYSLKSYLGDSNNSPFQKYLNNLNQYLDLPEYE